MNYSLKAFLVLYSFINIFVYNIFASQEIITDYLNSISNSEGISVKMRNVISSQQSSLEIHELIHMVAVKPNYIKAEYKTEVIIDNKPRIIQSNWIILGDGRNLYLISVDARYYQKLNAPQDFWQIFDPIVWKRAPDLHYVVARWFTPFALMHPDDPGGFFHNVRYKGEVKIDGEMLYQFQLNENLDLIDGRRIPGILFSDTLPIPEMDVYFKKNGNIPKLKQFSVTYGEKEYLLFKEVEWGFGKQSLDQFKLPKGLTQVDSMLDIIKTKENR